MELVYSQTPSGLVLAEHAQDEAAVARALKDHDSDLRLVPQFSEEWQCRYWAVYRSAGSERPAEFVCAWMSERGEPYPLSHRLVDLVKELDRNTRSSAADPDRLNAERRERQEADFMEAIEELAADVATTAGVLPAFHRGPHLRRAHARTGYWESEESR